MIPLDRGIEERHRSRSEGVAKDGRADVTEQWRVRVHVKRPVEVVWELTQDLRLITHYHPEVARVEFPNGETVRAAGVRYKCVVPRKKFWCVEEITEHVPLIKSSVTVTSDSWGMSRWFRGLVTDLFYRPASDDATGLELVAYYDPSNVVVRLVNAVLIRSVMRKRARRVLLGLKAFAERQ